VDSHWRYNWAPRAAESWGARVILFALLVVIVCMFCR